MHTLNAMQDALNKSTNVNASARETLKQIEAWMVWRRSGDAVISRRTRDGLFHGKVWDHLYTVIWCGYDIIWFSTEPSLDLKYFTLIGQSHHSVVKYDGIMTPNCHLMSIFIITCSESILYLLFYQYVLADPVRTQLKRNVPKHIHLFHSSVT